MRMGALQAPLPPKKPSLKLSEWSEPAGETCCDRGPQCLALEDTETATLDPLLAGMLTQRAAVTMAALRALESACPTGC